MLSLGHYYSAKFVVDFLLKPFTVATSFSLALLKVGHETLSVLGRADCSLELRVLNCYVTSTF